MDTVSLPAVAAVSLRLIDTGGDNQPALLHCTVDAPLSSVFRSALAPTRFMTPDEVLDAGDDYGISGLCGTGLAAACPAASMFVAVHGMAINKAARSTGWNGFRKDDLLLVTGSDGFSALMQVSVSPMVSHRRIPSTTLWTYHHLLVGPVVDVPVRTVRTKAA